MIVCGDIQCPGPESIGSVLTFIKAILFFTLPFVVWWGINRYRDEKLARAQAEEFARTHERCPHCGGSGYVCKEKAG
jgi:hypothetical protein